MSVTKEMRISQAVADKLLGIVLSGHTSTMLTVSTSMIPRVTAEALGEDRQTQNAPLWDVLAYEPWAIYGWIIQLPAVVGDLARPELRNHSALKKLMVFAWERGYSHLMLDRDAAPLPEDCGLPTFNW